MIQGEIRVDEYLRTSDEHIYAIGDVIETPHLVTKEKFLARLAGPANKQSRIAADNIYGRQERYKGSLGTGIVRVFDIAAGCTGANEKMLKKAGIPYRASLIHAASHAGYYPGAVPVSVKLPSKSSSLTTLHQLSATILVACSHPASRHASIPSNRNASFS